MAGIGKRLRPLTLTTPKPLISIAGKPIVEWLVYKISEITTDKITDIAFIIGNFPFDISKDLYEIGKSLDAKVHIFVQDKALGTAHAISFASELLEGPAIIAFADTLFDTDIKFIPSAEVVIWTKKVKNPQAYGVVIKDKKGMISAFVEKPAKYISDEAIIGIYYFKNSELLADKIRFILENKMLENNEYQLTNALQMLLDAGLTFASYSISEWLDCGNLALLLNTSKYVISNFDINNNKNNNNTTNSIIIQPCYIADNVDIKNSVIGPNVSIEENTIIDRSIISNSLILANSNLFNVNIDNSIVGNNVNLQNSSKNIYIGDYSETKI